jgi:uncharacterized LabA/DUF88 family protein
MTNNEDKKEPERIAVYIDGSNLYHKLKDLGVEHTTDFDYFGLCQKLARAREVISNRYYTGIVRAKQDDVKGQKLRKGQQKLFNKLRGKNFTIKQGFLMKSDGKYHEKGVDVQIAIDLLIGAYEDMYDTAILISSDTDLIPAIKKVRYLEKKVEYVGFSHSPSLGLEKNVDLSRLLIREDIEEFIFKSIV